MLNANHTVLRDTEDLDLGDNLSAFMRQIGTSDLIYIFLTDAYLKSPNCMYELLMIWQTCGDDQELFRKRTRVIVAPGIEIQTIAGRMKYTAYWLTQRNEIKAIITENVDALGPTDLRNLRRIQDFAHKVSEMLAQIADSRLANSIDEYICHAILELNERSEKLSD